MYISIDAHYIGSILNAVALDFCQFFGDITIVVNGKVGFLNFRCSINCPLSQTKDSTLINNICTLPYSPAFLTSISKTVNFLAHSYIHVSLCFLKQLTHFWHGTVVDFPRAKKAIIDNCPGRNSTTKPFVRWEILLWKKSKSFVPVGGGGGWGGGGNYSPTVTATTMTFLKIYWRT